MTRSRISDEDTKYGETLRVYRRLARISQTALGKLIGVSFQQVQKYEKGVNRIPVSKMRQIGVILNIPGWSTIGDASVSVTGVGHINPDTIELMRNYQSITNEKVREKVRGLVAVLSQQQAA